jgi:hypothetical protein
MKGNLIHGKLSVKRPRFWLVDMVVRIMFILGLEYEFEMDDSGRRLVWPFG